MPASPSAMELALTESQFRSAIDAAASAVGASMLYWQFDDEHVSRHVTAAIPHESEGYYFNAYEIHGNPRSDTAVSSVIKIAECSGSLLLTQLTGSFTGEQSECLRHDVRPTLSDLRYALGIVSCMQSGVGELRAHRSTSALRRSFDNFLNALSQ